MVDITPHPRVIPTTIPLSPLCIFIDITNSRYLAKKTHEMPIFTGLFSMVAESSTFLFLILLIKKEKKKKERL